MKNLFLLIVYIFFLWPSLLFATTNNQTMGWYGFFNKTELTDNYSWWTETQLRYNFDDKAMGQTLVRTGLLRELEGRHKSQVGLLFAYIHTGLLKEHRFAFQHAMAYGGFMKSFSHRIRYELRSLEDQGSISNRFRYLLRYSGPQVFEGTKLIFWDEVFLNIDDNDNDYIDHLDRNRFFVGFRKNIAKLSLEFGYLNQWTPRESLKKMDHTFVVYMFF